MIKQKEATWQGYRNKTSFKLKRNSSCESNPTTTKSTIRTKIKKKQHQSMGNLRDMYERPNQGQRKTIDYWEKGI